MTANNPIQELSSATLGAGFTQEQKEYLQGFLSGIAARGLIPDGNSGWDSSTASPAGPASGSPPEIAAEETIHGIPISEVTKQEVWKHELHGLDAWDRLLEHAGHDKFPDEADNFRFRYFGLFHVAPTQNSFMLRCRIPAGELTSDQLDGLADIAQTFGDGRAAITTRCNIQIRQIAPKHLIDVLIRLQSIGLTSRGSGVDNIRNITASPTAGIDPQELIDVRPFAHALHHYILNHRDLYDLPRKFNVAFEGGGSIDTAADTNDIGFMAVRLPLACSGISLKDGSEVPLAPGVYFRAELAGITGHKQFARDAGLLLKPNELIAVAAAMIRVFRAHGDRTDRKRARLKYLIDRWGTEKFLEETQARLSFPLVRFPLSECVRRPSALRHGHIGVYRQKQPGKNYIGVAIPVGIMHVKQMRRLAQLARNYGSSQIRLTPWQNLIIPDVPDAFVETVKRNLLRIGFHYEASSLAGGLVACTGRTGCKWAATDTKGHALALVRHLEKRVQLDQPINIHLTGCPNSCAQHYMGDIGLQGVKVNAGGSTVEGYAVAFGGGNGDNPTVAAQVFSGISFDELPGLLERVLKVYLDRRQPGESFAAFTRRHSVGRLQEMFSP